jgi:hypothetical protein
MSNGRLTALLDRADATAARIVAASSVGHTPGAQAQQKELRS